jgi:hypothetical protein
MKLALILALILLGGTALASEVSFGTGEDKDCSLARAFAIKDAIENYSKQEFDFTQIQECNEKNTSGVNCTFNKQLQTEVAGTLRRVISETNKQKKDLCVVEVKVELEKARTFFGDVTGDSSVYAGSAMNFKITTYERLYVYIFNVYNRTRVELLYPKHNTNTNFIDGVLKAEMLNTEFRTYLEPLSEYSKESIMVLFTKHRVTFKNQLTEKDIYDTIASIPVHSRKIVYHNFVIVRRK